MDKFFPSLEPGSAYVIRKLRRWVPRGYLIDSKISTSKPVKKMDLVRMCVLLKNDWDLWNAQKEGWWSQALKAGRLRRRKDITIQPHPVEITPLPGWSCRGSQGGRRSCLAGPEEPGLLLLTLASEQLCSLKKHKQHLPILTAEEKASVISLFAMWTWKKSVVGPGQVVGILLTRQV